MRGILVAVLVLGLVTSAHADSSPAIVHLHSLRKACLQDGDQLTGCVPLGPGYFLDDEAYAKLDTEVRRLQDSETRLQAENNSLRASAASWQPGWVTALSIAVVSAALTVYVERKL